MPDKTPPEMLAAALARYVAKFGNCGEVYEQANHALTAYAEWQETHTAVLTERAVEVSSHAIGCPSNQETGQPCPERDCPTCWLAYLTGSDAGGEGRQ